MMGKSCALDQNSSLKWYTWWNDCANAVRSPRPLHDKQTFDTTEGTLGSYFDADEQYRAGHTVAHFLPRCTLCDVWGQLWSF